MVKIIAINAGSSSLKFQLLQMPEEEIIAKGLIERIGLKDPIFSMTTNGEKIELIQPIQNHQDAVKILLHMLIEQKAVSSLNDIDGIGHRLVHGGEDFSDSVLITEEAIAHFEKLSDLAPLHNPANITGIKEFQKSLPQVPAVAVFDTAFHQTMPESSFLYSIPYDYYKKYGIRKYGFHGTSHKYVSGRAAELLNRPLESIRLISCHLGNGASIAAIDGSEGTNQEAGW